MEESKEDQLNRLRLELSPYLQQHAANPVDWYPWGEEAFEAARSQDKPIFLSIGYATCHWCHVMEKESFQSRQLAQVLNDTFINVKVDREELPQVDSLYMEFAQAMLGGGGGWPLNLVLTPELKPIFAATYMPPEDQGGQLGLRQLALRIQELWSGAERELVLEQAEHIAHAVGEELERQKSGDLPEPSLLEMVLELYYKMADPIYGGIQGAPKFPMGFQLNFLLRHGSLRSESRALFFVHLTLEMMYRGGIYDHLGGGFARYSIDPEWMIPHFEKMLYDNAILALSYMEAWSMTRHSLYRAVAEDIFRYLLRDMMTEEGGFCSAEDADTEGHEGLFYTWTPEEIDQVLGPDEGALFCDFYGVTPHGNFEGRSVLYIPKRLEEYASERQVDPMKLADNLAEARAQLWQAREGRIHPAKDDQVIVGWNGLVIRALSEASMAFVMPHYMEAATRTATFLREKLWYEGQLWRRWRSGQGGLPACLEDYAYLASGLLSLYTASGQSEWLAWAIELTNVLTEGFHSAEGPFYRTDGRDPNLICRQVEMYDGAEPSGNAVQAENLLRLYQLTGADRYRIEAEQVLTASRAFLEEHPLGGAYHLLALQRYLDDGAPLVVVALNEEESLYQEIIEALAASYRPHTEVIWRRVDDPMLFELIPSLKAQAPIEGQTTLYLCRDGVCEMPLSDSKEIFNALTNL